MKKNIINILLILTILLFIIIKIKDIYNWQQDSNKTIKEIRNLNNIIKDNEYIKLKNSIVMSSVLLKLIILILIIQLFKLVIIVFI